MSNESAGILLFSREHFHDIHKYLYNSCHKHCSTYKTADNGVKCKHSDCSCETVTLRYKLQAHELYAKGKSGHDPEQEVVKSLGSVTDRVTYCQP